MLLRQMRERLVERLSELRLDVLNPLVPGLARLQCRLNVAGDDEARVGQLGGTLELPRDFVWPTDDNGRPMIGWLQVTLASLPESLGLPNSGRLIAFLARTTSKGPPTEIDCDGGWLTIVGDATECVPTHAPQGAPTLDAQPLAAKLSVSLPRASSVCVHATLTELTQREEAAWEREWELEPDELPPETPVSERYQSLLDALDPPGLAVALLCGHAVPQQDDPRLDHVSQTKPELDALAQRVAEAKTWEVLLQAPAARTHGYDVMTGGALYALIRKDARQNGQFADAIWRGQR